MRKKFPFDVKYRPQIESGEYKVEIGRDNPWPARIVCWDFDGNNLIVAVRNPNDREEGLIYSIDGKHKAVCPKIDSDLFIITPKPEMTEFEKALSKCLCDAVVRPEEEDYDKWAKEYAPELLELARKEIEEELKEKVLHDFWKQAADQCAEARKAAKAEALKNLPRWKKCTKDTLRSYGDEHFEYRRDGCYVVIRGREILLSDLEKLPKEDEK